MQNDKSSHDEQPAGFKFALERLTKATSACDDYFSSHREPRKIDTKEFDRLYLELRSAVHLVNQYQKLFPGPLPSK